MIEETVCSKRKEDFFFRKLYNIDWIEGVVIFFEFYEFLLAEAVALFSPLFSPAI